MGTTFRETMEAVSKVKTDDLTNLLDNLLEAMSVSFRKVL